MEDTLGSQTISTRLQRIAQRAHQDSELVFNNLYYLIDLPLLREAYRRTRKNAAPGIDKITAKQYAEHLETNLNDLHQRLRRRAYTAPPVKRCWIEKEPGKDRPIGIPTLEDKLVQRAVEMLLSAIYDQDFKPFSYGFIKGRNQHQALNELRNKVMATYQLTIIDADVSGFFDNIAKRHLRTFIERRVNDGGIKQLIGKWLNAGIDEDGIVHYPDKGTPQGGVISPLLANIYLHNVLDEWIEKEVKPRMKGRCFIIRFADDFVIGCTHEEDAERIMKALPKRFEKYGLTIHPTKTKCFNFSRPITKESRAERNTLDFLGLTHYWARSLRGSWIIKRQTQRQRQACFMKGIWQWCKDHRHDPIEEQHDRLSSKLRGYNQYYGVRSNYKALEAIYEHAQNAWRYWLSRRSQKSLITLEYFSDKLMRLLPLPIPRLVHAI